MENNLVLQRQVRLLILFFMFALTVSGLTAIPLQWELAVLNQWMGLDSFVARFWPSLAEWIDRVNTGVQNGYGQYPFLAYGTDWLAFAHILIAVLFIGPLRDPVRNLWVIEFGMIACALIVPWTLILGTARGIPPFWQLIDMSFGIFGFIPLWLVRRDIIKITTEPGFGA